MHLYKSVKNFLFDQNYFIDIWDSNIHLFGFIDIITLNDKLIELAFETFRLTISGENFRVLKLTKNEILITGIMKEMRFFS